MKKPKQRIIYDNYDILEKYEEEARYNLNERDIKDPSDDEIYNECWELNQWEWEEEEQRLEDVFNGSDKFLAVGTCGRWDGNFAGGFIFSTLNELMSHFKDCDYKKIWDENGHFYMKGSHHDGTDSVEIKRLTDKGCSYYENWEYGSDNRTERQVHEKLFNNSHYSNLINYMHNAYGCKRREFEEVSE